MKYVYPAIFQKDKDSKDTWCVDFPDVEGAATFGETLYEALEMAEDALAGILVMYEDFKAGKYYKDEDGNEIKVMNNRIVEPTPIEKVVAEPNEYSTAAFVTLIKADTDAYRKILAELHKKRQEEKTAQRE